MSKPEAWEGIRDAFFSDNEFLGYCVLELAEGDRKNFR